MKKEILIQEVLPLHLSIIFVILHFQTLQLNTTIDKLVKRMRNSNQPSSWELKKYKFNN